MYLIVFIIIIIIGLYIYRNKVVMYSSYLFLFYTDLKTFKYNYNTWKNYRKINELYELYNPNKKYDAKLVIARYSEDISWSDKYKNIRIIYNKNPNSPIENAITLPNVGREGHTYLYYIINNYDNLPKTVIFFQGSHEDHCIYPINYYMENDDKFTALIFKRKESRNWEKNLFVKLMKKWYKYKSPSPVIDSKYSFGEFWDKYIQKPYPKDDILKWTLSAFFAVDRELIRKNSKKYYQNLLNIMEKHNNPMEGFYLEKCWYYIFN